MTVAYDSEVGRRRRGCGCETCYYCDQWVSGRHEHDHFPVPKVCGGIEMVAACLSCHDLKDRLPLDRWPLGLVATGMDGLARSMPAIRLPGLDGLAADALVSAFIAAISEGEALRVRWSTWSPATRLSYAKILSIKYHAEHVRAKWGDLEVD